MSSSSGLDIEAANVRAGNPCADPATRRQLIENSVCPDCGSRYHWSSIPWQPGTCINTACGMYDPHQAAACYICEVPRWRCSC